MEVRVIIDNNGDFIENRFSSWTTDFPRFKHNQNQGERKFGKDVILKKSRKEK
jgi:hypothetical protein